MIKTLGWGRVPNKNSKLLDLAELIIVTSVCMHAVTYNHVMQILGLSCLSLKSSSFLEVLAKTVFMDQGIVLYRPIEYCMVLYIPV